jgi:hypothetical protein
VATFADIRAYVLHDGWIEEPGLARGRARTGDHRRYRKELVGGSILRTKIPHGLRDDVGADLLRHILRDQLRVTEEQFWAVVHGSTSEAALPPPETEAIPGWLVERLLLTVGLPEADVRLMTPDEARPAWEAYRARPHSIGAGADDAADASDAETSLRERWRSR